MACGDVLFVPIHAFFDEKENVLVQIPIDNLKAKSKKAAKNADIKVNYTLRGFLLTVDVQLPSKQIKKYRLAYTEKLHEIDIDHCHHEIKDNMIRMYLRKKDRTQPWQQFIEETKSRSLADSNDGI